jgi:hypothetical protein
MTTISLKMNFIKKAFIIFNCLIGLAGIKYCNAQSIVGKWKQISGKMYCTPVAVQNSHGHLQPVMDMPKVEAITSGGTKTSNTGTWSMSGKTVTVSIPGHPPMSGIISETDNTLIYTLEMPKSEHMQVIKREWTYLKI